MRDELPVSVANGISRCNSQSAHALLVAWPGRTTWVRPARPVGRHGPVSRSRDTAPPGAHGASAPMVCDRDRVQLVRRQADGETLARTQTTHPRQPTGPDVSVGSGIVRA